MPKVLLDNPFAKWASAITLVVGLCGLVTYCFKARAYVDEKVEKLEEKTANTYATKESVKSMGDEIKVIGSDIKVLIKAVGRLEEHGRDNAP
jgi:uncharacterized protein (UPF0335 family)